MITGFFRIWIIGGGGFGYKAAERMKLKYPDAQLLVVESDDETCLKIKTANFNVVCMDGISFLSSRLFSKTDLPDWIVPAVPIHMAYQWVQNELLPDFFIQLETIPIQIISRLPNPMIGKDKQVYMSVADFICPDNCPEPETVCTVTQKPRPYSLFEHLSELSDDRFVSVVIRSRQLAPGVGGFKPEVLFSALQQVKNAGSSILFSTACRCHGVMNAFSIEKKVT